MGVMEPTVYVVDDDQALCEAIQWLVESAGLPVRTFGSAEQFLAAYTIGAPGCLVLDVRMHDMTGLELQSCLAERKSTIPVILITGHGDIAMAVRAVKAGAMDFLEKPVNDQVLLQRIRLALELDARRQADAQSRTEVTARLGTLTRREREVLELIVAGHANKQTAAALGVTRKTVEVHRKRVMQKMGARSAVALTRMVLQASGDPAHAADPPPSGETPARE